MKVYKDGKELKNVTVRYGANNQPLTVVDLDSDDKVNEPAYLFEFKDEEPQTKKKVTRKAPAAKKK